MISRAFKLFRSLTFPAVALCLLSSQGATITDNVSTAEGSIRDGAVWTFQPMPAHHDGLGLVSGRQVKVTGNSQGVFTVTLKQGIYQVGLDGSPIGWATVPNDNLTYDLRTIGGWFSWLGGPFSFGMTKVSTNDTAPGYLASKLVAGSGITLDTSGVTNIVVATTGSAMPGTVGIVTETSGSTWTTRTLTPGSNKITISNPAGTAGNPTIDVAQSNLSLQSIGGAATEGQLPANSLTSGGIVSAGTGHNSKVWGTDGSGNPSWVTPFPGTVGTVVNTVATAGLLAVDSTKTNGIAATLSHMTNALGLTGSTSTFLRSDGTQVAPVGGVAGTVINSVAVSGLLAVDSSKTNGIAATFSHVTNALGYFPLTNTFQAIVDALGYTPLETELWTFDGATLSPTPDGFSQVSLTTNSFYIRDVGDNSAMGVTGVTIGGSSVLGVGNGLATINVYAPSGDNYFYADVQDDSSTLNVGIATGNSLDGFGSFLFMPDTTNANANVYFETSGRSSGNLMRVMNASTQALALSWDGAITTGDPSGGTKSPMKIGLNGSAPRLDLNGTGYDLTTGGGANYWTYNGSTVSNNVGRVRLYGATTNTGTLLSEGQITSLGIITTASEFDLPPGGSILFSNQLVLASSSAGILRINKSSGVAPAGIMFTAVAAANPFILQNGAGLEFLLGDQTDWTTLKLKSITTTAQNTFPTNLVAVDLIGSAIVTNNIGAILAVGNTGYVDVTKASQTNAVAGTLTVVYATNGVDLVDYTAVRWLFNGSGSDQTLAIPSGWRTNVYSAVPPKLTNSTITKMILSCNGPTSSAALQTNCYVSFEYFK